MTEKQALDYTRALYCNSTGDYYSWRNKKKSSNNTTIMKNSSISSVGFTKEQLDNIIKVANGKSVQFIIGDKGYYYDSKTKFNEDLILFKSVSSTPIVTPFKSDILFTSSLFLLTNT